MKDRNRLPEQIARLALEIVYLSTGKDYTIVKKPGEPITNHGRPCESQVGCRTQISGTDPPPENDNEQKILELTNKIIQLLTGEVPVRCDDVTVHFSPEEWEYVEGHKDLYKIAMMEEHQLLNSPDGSAERFHTVVSKPDVLNEDLKHIGPDDATSRTRQKIRVKREEDAASCAALVNVDVNPFTLQTRTDRASAHIKECEEGHLCDPNIYNPIEYSQSESTALKIKEEPASEEEDEVSDQTEIRYTSGIIKGEPTSYEEGEFPVIKTTTGNMTTRIIENSTSYEDGSLTAADVSMSMELLVKEDSSSLTENSSDRSHPSGCIQVTDIAKIEDGGEFRSVAELPGTLTTFRCPNSDSEFVKHQAAHEEKRFSCSYCGKRFSTNAKLTAHMGTHSGKKPFSCPDCGKSFNRNSDLTRHKKIHAGDRPFPCSVCERRFTQKSDLAKHQSVHTGEKPFACSECGKCFSQRRYLNKHRRIHAGDQRFSCSECGKCFSQQCYLYKHMRHHTRDRRFSCSLCGRSFIQNADLVKHQKLHTGEKPFICSECGKRFSQLCSLSKHMRCHTGEKPFPCPECGKRFSQLCSLSKHMRCHTGHRPFPCPECGKCFSQGSDLARHRKTHMSKRPFSCPECGKGFTQNSDLLKHQRVHTGEKLQPPTP